MFDAHSPNTVNVTKVMRINPDYESDQFSINGLMSDVRALLEEKNIAKSP